MGASNTVCVRTVRFLKYRAQANNSSILLHYIRFYFKIMPQNENSLFRRVTLFDLNITVTMMNKPAFSVVKANPGTSVYFMRPSHWYCFNYRIRPATQLKNLFQCLHVYAYDFVNRRRVNVFGTDIMLSGLSNVSQAVAGPCWLQLYGGAQASSSCNSDHYKELCWSGVVFVVCTFVDLAVCLWVVKRILYSSLLLCLFLMWRSRRRRWWWWWRWRK